MLRLGSALICLVAGAGVMRLCADDVVFNDDFSSATQVDNPWSGVDGQGQIKVIPGSQLLVDSSGAIGALPSGPSIAVGDLDGDGLLDLVIADAYGFFWYFKNYGTKDAPKFTTGEIMPVWFGDPCPSPWGQEGLAPINVIPRIQLIDIDHSGKLDLVVGNYSGKLFYLFNQGSAASPVFKTPRNLDHITIPTRHQGILWCNYLAPFLYDWRGTGVMDLTMGDGSYSANSIYLLANKGTNNQPVFSEDSTTNIIRGLGREHLIPQVVSWNGDGKADVLATEREGFLNLFLNKGADSDSGNPTIGEGTHVSVGGVENLGKCSTVTMAKLDPKTPPGLIVADASGHVFYSPNTGTPGNYQFGPMAPLKGVNPRPPILQPDGWSLGGAFGSPYDLLVTTNAKVEPGFKPPPDSGVTTALRFYIDEPAKPNPTFPEHFYPEVDARRITRSAGIALAADTDYKISFWVRADGNISDFSYAMGAVQTDANGTVINSPSLTDNVSLSGSWYQYSTPYRFKSASDDKHAVLGFSFSFYFSGKGSLYLASLKIEKGSGDSE